MSDKKKLAKVRMVAYESVKNITHNIEWFKDIDQCPCSDPIFDNAQILEELLPDIENIAVKGSCHPIDEIIPCMDECYESLATIKRGAPYLDARTGEELREHCNIIDINLKRFISIFNKLTQLQKE